MILLEMINKNIILFINNATSSTHLFHIKMVFQMSNIQGKVDEQLILS